VAENAVASLFPFVRRSRLKRAEQRFEGACRELRRVEAIRAEAEITLQLIASHPHGGLLSNIARVKLERLGANRV
jgi:hypothetical protein